MIKKLFLSVPVLGAAGTGFLAFSHLILPADMDDCQQDVSHRGHLTELTPFHCIGHSEGSAMRGWDHVHPWMTEAWHAERDLSVPQTSDETEGD